MSTGNIEECKAEANLRVIRVMNYQVEENHQTRQGQHRQNPE
jgi:hypothetical protein